MLLYYIRHGEPIYDPDSLTPLGERQAEALSKRLARYGVDKIYSSTSTRARMTAKPTCEALSLEPELLAFAHENLAWHDFTVPKENGKGRTWISCTPKMRDLFNSKAIRDLGDRWYEHPDIREYHYENGVHRVYDAADAFLKDLGYEHVRYTGKYKVINGNDKRIAFFAHAGFGEAFLSAVLDIPYPMFCTHFGLCHSGMTVIDFSEENGYSIPKVRTLSSDSHLYHENVPSTDSILY